MPMLNLLTIATAPVIVILVYVFHRDKYEKEPIGLLLLSLIGGAAIIPLVIRWENGMMNIVGEFPSKQVFAFYNAFAVAALCEESMKLLVFLLLIYRSSWFNEKFDAIVYAVYISMGFALVENILYVTGGGAEVGLTRAFTAVPAHAIFAISMGFYLGKAKFSSRKKVLYFALALLVPMLFHGTYDYILMLQPKYLVIIFVMYVVLLYFFGFRRMKKSIDNSVYNDD